MYERVLPALWMLVPREERAVIARDFDIVATGVTEVRDQTVLSDGFTYDDLGKLTVEAMSEYVGSTETLPRLWELTVAKARSIVHPVVGMISGEPKVIEEVISDKPTTDGKKATTK